MPAPVIILKPMIKMDPSKSGVLARLKVAVIQATPAFFNLESGLERVQHWAQEAARQGAELVLFPESFLPAYPRGLSFGTVIGSRSESGRDQWQDYWENSVTIGGPADHKLRRLAARLQIWLVIGVTERYARSGSLYCTLLYYDPNGNLRGHHRKIKPTGAERIVWGEGDGKDLQLLAHGPWQIGGLICWENYMPLARMTLYQQGVNLYLAPTADERDRWQSTMVHIALEARAYVLGCNQVVSRADYPLKYRQEIPEDQEVLSRGGSVIVNPSGEVVAGPLWQKEGILYAELDYAAIIRSKMDFDPIGHYQRPDLFTFVGPLQVADPNSAAPVQESLK